ncbi:hypothetical protein B296_00017535 [Ensete ventricosum]|uniref:Uncharacterized protein n=1 Tax=Ensete ventricosum TaxID=4639 RepID=A0A427B4S9_ENSVE|nr:hypothetical protein B296_00017535 [Ensete ventricosum]
MDALEFFVGARGICSRPEFVAMFQWELLILDRGTLFGLTSWAELHSLRKPYDEDRGCGLGLAPREMVRDKASFRDLDLSQVNRIYLTFEK